MSTSLKYDINIRVSILHFHQSVTIVSSPERLYRFSEHLFVVYRPEHKSHKPKCVAEVAFSGWFWWIICVDVSLRVRPCAAATLDFS